MSEVVSSPSPSSPVLAEGGPDSRAAAREALIGKTVAGRYVLRGLLGHGGMGAVYEAEHLGIGKRCAIKFVDPEFATDDQVRGRFAREARAMSAIESAHIVTIFDAGTEEGRPYLVMELLRGEDLGQWLRRARRVPLDEALHVVAQVLKGLAKAHAAGIIHRDLKPDNVFLVKGDTDPLFAKIVDFGVSKIERPTNRTSPLALTGRGTVLGTPFYMSPEQAQAMPDVDGRADLYSAGAILFECLTGRPPHTGETYEQIILSICMRDAPDMRAIDAAIPAPVAAFVTRALSRDRIQRFPTAERMLAALHEIAPEERWRVPLDAISSATLLSPQIEAPPSSNPIAEARPAAATRLVGALAEPLVAAAVAQPAPGRASAPSAAPASLPLPSLRSGTSAAHASIAIPGLGRTPGLQRKSTTKLVATAAVATLTGIGLVLGVVSLLDKPSVAPRIPAASASPSSPSPPAAVIAPAATAGEAASAPTSASAAEPGPKPSASASGRPSHGGPARGPAKPLDIARDLP